MRGILHVDPADAMPIWRQIEEGVRRLVASKALLPGSVMPSVREMAKELCINPATVAKAYQRLVDAVVLMMQRGEGTFVAETPPTFKAEDHGRTLHEAALRYASVAMTMGVNKRDAESALSDAWNELKETRKGGSR